MAALIVAYAIRFSLLSVQVHDGYGTPAYDMAIPDQGIWLLAHFHAPFSTVMGRNVFADHTSFIFVLLVPLFWVYPHTAALLVAQSVLLAAAAIPIYLYARRRLDSTALATGLAAAYLLNPALQWGNLEQFHVECFTTLLIALALYAALESRFRLLLVVVGLLFLCKEDVGLLVAPLAVWVWWRRDRRIGGWILGATVVWSLIASEVIIRSMVGVTNVHTGRIPFGGLTGTVRTAFAHPAKFFNYLWNADRPYTRPFYVWQMFVAFGWSFFYSPEVATIALLAIGDNVLTSWPYSHQIYYHYSMPIVPVLAFGTVFAVGAMGSQYGRRVATSLVVACSLTACVVWGLAPFSQHTYAHMSPNSPEVHDIDTVLRSLPRNADVSAYYPYVSHIDHRVNIYMWPNPFSADYWHRFEEEGKRLPQSAQIQYLVLPTDLSDHPQVLAEEASHFQIVVRAGDVALYQRISPDS